MIGKSRRPMTHEDIELWSYVTRGVHRLKRAQRRKEAVAVAPAQEPEPAAAAKKPPPGKFTRVKVAIARPAAPAPAPTKPAHKPLVPMEPKAKRKLGRGKMDVEARIDLHGMRQDEAHAALHRFLVDAHAADARLVLVITGKGKTSSEGLHAGQREVGILRRMTPHWLSEPGLRSIVLGYEAATVRHGGDGAIYVRLRKGPGA